MSAVAAQVAAGASARAGNGGNGPRLGWGNGPHCLLRGTTVATADGNRQVEDLRVGDVMPTMFGGARPIRWIARYPFKKSDSRKPWAQYVRPIRIARSALAPNVPEKDLLVTWGHALFLDGLLIQAGNLVNGATIVREEAREYDELEYFNIKFDEHDVIYAEGAPVDTLLTVDESAVNFAEYYRLYGADSDGGYCAPFVQYRGGRSELKARVRSVVSPWFDRREPVDVIRDRLEERAAALSRHPELVG